MKLSKKNPLIIILLGKSGSGKGTQADLLREKFGLDYIGSGDLLRARGKKKDFTGRKIAKILAEGKLIPTPAIFKLWSDATEKLKNKNSFKGLIMDGNPRKILEAYLIDETFGFYEWDKNVKALLVDISDKEAIWRLTKRRICKNCKEIIPFVGEFRKMKKCPKCGGELMPRSDDTIAAAKNRLAWFKKDVQPIVNYYRKTGRLIRINGEQSIEDVFKDVLKVLK
ncbi:MAG: nucleoside monophosphate kinase [Candidatus Pacebacteria bacterium]|nr:nucleoside monophosphate kinase [Candidatus Paceibacterota bacterium]